ncbi:MAG: M4 family metallopeptidase [bacterium]
MQRKVLVVAVATALIGTGMAVMTMEKNRVAEVTSLHDKRSTPTSSPYMRERQHSGESVLPTRVAPHDADLIQIDTVAPAPAPQLPIDLATPFRSGKLVEVNRKSFPTLKLQSADHAASFLRGVGEQQGMMNPEGDFALTSAKRDDVGNVFYKFQQTHQDIPVFGREMVVSTQNDGAFISALGEWESQVDVATNPSLEGSAALSIAVAGAEDPLIEAPTVLEEPALTIFVAANGGQHLSYRTVITYISLDAGYQVSEWLIDAHTGEKLESYSRMHSGLTRNVYTYNDQCISQYSNNLPGTRISDPANGDAHASAAFENTGHSYWFFKHMFDRDSFDADGIAITTTVHAKFQGQNGCSGDNAMFDTGRKQMIFGSGGNLLSNPAGALDIVGHELTHGVTFSESNLTYRNESGALNEALSDIFGAAVEAWVDAGGSQTGNPSAGLQANDDTWMIGEDAALDISFQRFMNDPTQDGHSRDDYNDRYTGTSDNGGVHSNSGIANLAFYLLTEGGTHPDSGVSTIEVTGIGMEDALDIYYHASTNLFTSSTGFEGARSKLAQSAEILFGECSTEWQAVHLANDAVNVPGSWTACDGGDSGNGDDGGSGGGSEEPPVEVTPSSILASASSEYSGSYPASQAIDGSPDTPWVSSTIYNARQWQWLELDLGDVSAIGQMNIDWWGWDYARTMVVEYSVDGSNWYSNGYVNQYSPGITKINLNTNARYLRLWMTAGNYGRWYVIREIGLQ